MPSLSPVQSVNFFFYSECLLEHPAVSSWFCALVLHPIYIKPELCACRNVFCGWLKKKSSPTSFSDCICFQSCRRFVELSTIKQFSNKAAHFILMNPTSLFSTSYYWAINLYVIRDCRCTFQPPGLWVCHSSSLNKWQKNHTHTHTCTHLHTCQNPQRQSMVD